MSLDLPFFILIASVFDSRAGGLCPGHVLLSLMVVSPSQRYTRVLSNLVDFCAPWSCWTTTPCLRAKVVL